MFVCVSQRAQYPKGFYVVTLVRERDEACTGAERDRREDEEWLWEAALWPELLQQRPRDAVARVKRLTVTVQVGACECVRACVRVRASACVRACARAHVRSIRAYGSMMMSTQRKCVDVYYTNTV